MNSGSAALFDPTVKQMETILGGILVIQTQPSAQCDCKGNKVTFSVYATGGTGSLHYLWKRKRPGESDFTAFGAKDSTKLPIYNIGVGTESPDGTLYQVTVSDQTNQVLSANAMLTVNQIVGIAPVGIATYTLNQGGNLWLKVQTSGNTPTNYQWIKKYGSNDWRDLAENGTIKGSSSEQLNFTGISVADSGIYKVRVTFPTINGNQCTETSTITRKINVIPLPDKEAPYFINLTEENRIICMSDLEAANWNETATDIAPNRLDYHELVKSNPLYAISSLHIADNVTPPAAIVLHWGIYSDREAQHPISDEAGNLLQNQTGPLADYVGIIRLTKNSLSDGNYLMVFWLEDEAGNLTPDNQRYKINLTVQERPQIAKNF